MIGASPIKNVGDKIAAEIEAIFGKPPGWLDREHYSIEESRAIYRTAPRTIGYVYVGKYPLLLGKKQKYGNQLAYNYKPKYFEQMVATTAEVSSLAFALQVQDDMMESPVGISFPMGLLLLLIQMKWLFMVLL